MKANERQTCTHQRWRMWWVGDIGGGSNWLTGWSSVQSIRWDEKALGSDCGVWCWVHGGTPRFIFVTFPDMDFQIKTNSLDMATLCWSVLSKVSQLRPPWSTNMLVHVRPTSSTFLRKLLRKQRNPPWKHNKAFKEQQILSTVECNERNQPLKAQTTLMQHKTTFELY